MKQLSKLEAAKQLFIKNISLYKCPICQTSMHFDLSGAFVCEKHHQFDIAKPGYVYLLTHSNKTKYEKMLFEARHRIFEADFFKGLTDQLATLLNSLPNGMILDAGSGEGSMLAAIRQQITSSEHTYIGIDIAKAGIKQAARDYSGILWHVADLANSPFASKQIDVILNILSPSNYKEFTRILKPTGHLIKVVPEEKYLQELRQVDERKEVYYSNQEVLARFSEEFELISSERITYTVKLSAERVTDLLTMTPLGWHLTETEQKMLLKQTTYTVDYRILVGMAKK